MRTTKLALATVCVAVACLAASAAASKRAPTITPIVFKRGAPSTAVSGAVLRDERALYSVKARDGQLLELSITSPEKNAVAQIYTPGAKVELRDSRVQITGETLKGAAEGDDATRWSGKLQRSGEYLLVIGSTRGNTSYRLRILIR